MDMKYQLAICLAALLALTSCSEETDDVLSPDNQEQSVNSTIKATISDGIYNNWNIGEGVSLLHNGQKYTAEIQESGLALALYNAIDGLISNDNPLYGVYPAANAISSDPNGVKITIPAIQTGGDSGYDRTAVVSIARTTSDLLDFHNIGGGIHLKFQMSGVTKIELESVDGYALSGIATIIWDNQGKPIVNEISDGNSIITFNSPDNSGFSSGKDYYISTLPCDLYGGYRLSIYKDGLVAHYFGVHQTVDRASFIMPIDLIENELSFDDPDAPLVEEDRPELDATTTSLLRQYQQNPTEENKQALLYQMGIRYDKVVARKKAKLRELEREAKTQNLIDEMQVIVDEMVENREIRLEQQFLRLIDPRNDDNPNDAWMVLRGASAPNAYIAYAPVTNAEYAIFKSGFTYDSGKENHLVVNITIAEAIAYCDWLTDKDSKHIYRLPSDEEWILSAGHMPKDVSMNAGHVEPGLTAVDAYKQTTCACGGIDFWGNCWEWTSSIDPEGLYIIKGGSWDSDRDDCRSEKSDVVRNGLQGYANVGFRILRTDR